MSQRTYYSEEAKQQAQAKTTAIVAICIALGATIGTVIAVLFAPQNGEETRNQLMNNMDEQMENGRNATDTAIEKLQQQMSNIQERFEEMTS
ncbi:MAG: YtxH domain-containing protein [Chloroflexota bacterium]